MFLETVKLALRAVRKNFLRSFLTVMGVVIGVSAVIAMATIAEGTNQQVKTEVSELGTDLLFIRPGQRSPGGPAEAAKGFSESDVAAISNQIAGLRAVAPQNTASVTVVSGGQNRKTTVVGSTNSYLDAQDWRIISGRAFSDAENEGRETACILGNTVSNALFGEAEPVGQSIRVGNIACNVVGVLGARGESGMGQDRDDIVLMPIKTFQRRVGGESYIDSIILSARDTASKAQVEKDVSALLRERRNLASGRDSDFVVNDMTQIADTMDGTTRLLAGLLGAVAVVSLIVGGIGIMNIMLVSVTERTREIGLRLAIGAFRRQVLMQFLVEAVVLSVLGGIGGIALGLGVGYAGVQYLGVPFAPNPYLIIVAFLVSALIGIVFGYFPARRASRLQPIDALRHE